MAKNENKILEELRRRGKYNPQNEMFSHFGTKR